MNATLRELLTDLKAAVIIGDPESVHLALERIRSAPDDSVPPSAMHPLGEVLARLPLEQLLPLLDDEDTLIRGMAAVAAAHLHQTGGAIPEEALLFAADDPAEEVRSALADVLAGDPAQAGRLAADWLTNASTPVQQTGLAMIQRLPRLDAQLLALLEPLDSAEAHDFRAQLVETVSALGETDRHRFALDLLDTWAGRPDPNIWVITRALSAAWSQEHSAEAVRILNKLAGTAGEIRSIQRARERHNV